jgi:hypothetical protein
MLRVQTVPMRFSTFRSTKPKEDLSGLSTPLFVWNTDKTLKIRRIEMSQAEDSSQERVASKRESKCPYREADLDTYVLNQMESEAERAFEEHLFTCQSCQEYVGLLLNLRRSKIKSSELA